MGCVGPECSFTSFLLFNLLTEHELPREEIKGKMVAVCFI